MADELEVLEKTEEAGKEIAPVLKNPFSNDAWVDNTIEKAHEEKIAETIVEKKEEIKKEEEEIVDANDFLKTNLGFDSWETAKTQVEEWRKKAETPSEIKFANDSSRILFQYLQEGKEEEAINLLNEKRKIDKLISVEINDSTAAEIVKLGIYQKNKSLTADEIDFVFNKKFAVPAKPVMDDTKTEDEYKNELSIWENKLAEVKKELVIEAKMAKPELDKLKTELILPDIKKGVDPKIAEEQQKALAVQAQIRENFVQALEKDYKNFNGYSATYKDKDVEIPIAYTIPEAEKTVLKEDVKALNIDAFFEERWFGEKVNTIQQIQEDLYFLKNRDKILLKMVNDAGAKVKATYIKSIRPVEVDGGNKGTFQPEGGVNEQKDALAKTMFKA